MRHRKRTIKLGRPTAHREAMLAGLVCSLIREERITTTIAKARAARSLAEKAVTLAKKAGASEAFATKLHYRRLAISRLRNPAAVRKLFDQVGPAAAARPGGYTRIVKLGKRMSDSSEMAILEWVDAPVATPAKAEEPSAAAAT